MVLCQECWFIPGVRQLKEAIARLPAAADYMNFLLLFSINFLEVCGEYHDIRREPNITK